MLPVSSLSFLPATHSQLAAVSIPKWRELLRKLKANGTVEESSSAFQQAKERVLLRLQQRRLRARLDPNRAFRRLNDRMLAARTSLRELKEEQKARLRQYYYEAVRGGTASAAGSISAVLGASSGSENGGGLLAVEEAGQELDPQRVQETLGPNGLFRAIVLAGVGHACKAFLYGASRTTIEGADIMRAALERPPGQALITVSNHVGAIDDPLITSALVPSEYLLQPSSLRWTMCASDRCFKSSLLASFFKAAKVLPVERGAGLAQYGMQVAQSRLAAGDWVHIFPEGTRSRTGKMGPVRKGVGWLVANCEQPPLVVPFVHSGMEKILPKGKALPQTGQDVRIVVGQPVDVADLMAAARKEGWSDNQLHVAITDRVGQALYTIKAQMEGLPLEEVVPQRAAAAITISEETLLPLIEEEMDSMRHRWRDSWQRSGLPSLTHRIRQAIAQQAATYAPAAAAEQFFQAAGSEAQGEGSEGEEAATGRASLLGLGSWAQCEAGADEGLVQGWSQRPEAEGEGETPAGEAARDLEVAAAAARRRGQATSVLHALRQRSSVLRMLRGSGERARLLGPAGPAVPPAKHEELSMGSVALDAGSSARLQQLMTSAAEYSIERVQRMRQLMGESPAAAALAH